MPSLAKIALSLACALALCSCNRGGNVRPSCPPPVVSSAPALPEVDPALMQAPNFEQQAMRRTFINSPAPTSGSAASNPN
jgi:hypothetical protein